jgi:hypothetical protein
MKKKISTICIAVAAISLFCACQPANETAPATNAPSVITTASTFSEETEPTENQTVTEATTEATTIEETIAETTAVPAEELIDSNIPNPFPEGSDDNVSFYQPGNRILDNVPVSLMRLVDPDELNNWIESRNIFDNPPSSLTEYTNIYSFIKHFDLSDEDVTEAMSSYLSSENPQIRISEDELNLILHGSEAEVIAGFASEYSIIVGDKIYSPHWIYTHTPAAYKQAGITPDNLRQKAAVYEDISFTPEARTALNEKINGYTGG